jgi:hypothetical protein
MMKGHLSMTASGAMISKMDMEFIKAKHRSIKDNGEMDSNMVTVTISIKRLNSPMLGNSSKIRNKVKEDSYTLMGVSTQANFKQIYPTVKVILSLPIKIDIEDVSDKVEDKAKESITSVKAQFSKVSGQIIAK